MLHLYALFAEYIHILCICAVYIRGTCIPPGACADYSTRKEFTPQKQKARDLFVSRLALKESRVSFWPYAPENGPPAALHARHSSSFWALGSCLRAYSRRRARVYPRTVPDRQNPRPLWHGCTLRRVRSGGRAGGRQGRWSSRCTAYRRYTAPYTQRRALAGRTAQMRPLFFNT